MVATAPLKNHTTWKNGRLKLKKPVRLKNEWPLAILSSNKMTHYFKKRMTTSGDLRKNIKICKNISLQKFDVSTTAPQKKISATSTPK